MRDSNTQVELVGKIARGLLIAATIVNIKAVLVLAQMCTQ